MPLMTSSTEPMESTSSDRVPITLTPVSISAASALIALTVSSTTACPVLTWSEATCAASAAWPALAAISWVEVDISFIA